VVFLLPSSNDPCDHISPNGIIQDNSHSCLKILNIIKVSFTILSPIFIAT
jgi:hypothetical protein